MASHPHFHFDFHEINESKLPLPTSDLSTALAYAPNNSGQFVPSIYLIGGCNAPYQHQVVRNEQNDDKKNDSSSKLQEEQQYQYYCPIVSNQNLVYIPHQKEVEERALMPHARYHHTTVTMNSRYIWAFGGRDEQDRIVDNIDIYDTVRDVWMTLKNDIQVSLKSDEANNNGDALEYKVSHHAAFEAGGGELLILTGGYTQDYIAVDCTIAIQTSKSLEHKKLVYAVKAPLNIARGDLRAIHTRSFVKSASDNVDGQRRNEQQVRQEVIAIVGGFSHDDGFCEALNSVEVYDIQSHSWILLEEELAYGRANPHLLFIHDDHHKEEDENEDHSTGEDQLFVVGGEQRGKFDPVTGNCEKDGGVGHHGDSDGGVGLPIELNRMLPNRKRYAIQNIEAVGFNHLINGGIGGGKREIRKEGKTNEIHLKVAKKSGGIPSALLYKYEVVPWPETDSIFIFGGILNSQHGRTNEYLSDKIYAANMKYRATSNTSVAFGIVLSIMFLGLLLLVYCGIIGWLYKRKKEQESERPSVMAIEYESATRNADTNTNFEDHDEFKISGDFDKDDSRLIGNGKQKSRRVVSPMEIDVNEVAWA